MADIRKINESEPYKRFKRAVVLTNGRKSAATDICPNSSPTSSETAPKAPRVNEDILVLSPGNY